MGVGNQRVVVREIALPWLPEKELRASLGFQVQEFIPMPVDDAVLDFDPIGEFEQDGRRMLRLLLVAAQRAMVDTRRAGRAGGQARAAGDRPGAVRPRALRRRCPTAGMDLEEGGEEAIVDIGAHVTNIVRPRARRDPVRPHPAVGRPRHHGRDRADPPGSRTTSPSV